MTAPVINVNSYSRLIQIGLLERLKLTPPFDTCSTYVTSKARVIQSEHIPLLGVYFLGDTFGPDGDANHAEPRFTVDLKLGFSYIIQNNDPEVAEDFLDAAHWSFMTMLHDPEWHRFPSGVLLESVTGGSHHRSFGSIRSAPGSPSVSETPIAEMAMEMTYYYRMNFEAIVDDLFEVVHVTAQGAPTDLASRRSIMARWAIDQSHVCSLSAIEKPDICDIRSD